MLRMTHPKTDGVTYVREDGTARAVLENLGWKADEPSLDEHTRAELDDIATGLGLDPSELKTKSDVKAAIEQARAALA